ncbi:hypothetical protein [Bacillus sp. E(2018)]|uniref:hypothetical protein n=1 Tax=Bacillus sp. E(2018) TaxID=2502239 RepID=UPI001484DD47|nr:hypothetical protein [Bacillus sp. E(2018)]
MISGHGRTSTSGNNMISGEKALFRGGNIIFTGERLTNIKTRTVESLIVVGST